MTFCFILNFKLWKEFKNFKTVFNYFANLNRRKQVYCLSICTNLKTYLNYFYTKKAGSNELALRFNVCLISLFGLFILYELCSISLCFVEYILFILCVVWFIFSCLCFVELNSFVLLIYTFVNFYYLVLFILLENIFFFGM